MHSQHGVISVMKDCVQDLKDPVYELWQIFRTGYFVSRKRKSEKKRENEKEKKI